MRAVRSDDPDNGLIQLFERDELDQATWTAFARRIEGWIKRKFPLLAEHAEDLAAEAALRAYRNFSSFRGESRFIRWVTRIAYYVTCEHLRNHGKQLDISFEDIPEDTPDPAVNLARDAQEPFEREYIQLEAEEALATLSENERAVYIMRESTDTDYTDIAAELGISENAARLARFRAFEKIGRWRTAHPRQ